MLRGKIRRQLLCDGVRLRGIVHAQRNLVDARGLEERLGVGLGEVARREADNRGVGQAARACEAGDGQRLRLAANLQVYRVANLDLLDDAIAEVEQYLARSRRMPLDDL